MELLHQLNREDGRTIVMVTHDESKAKETSRPANLVKECSSNISNKRGNC